MIYTYHFDSKNKRMVEVRDYEVATILFLNPNECGILEVEYSALNEYLYEFKNLDKIVFKHYKRHILKQLSN